MLSDTVISRVRPTTVARVAIGNAIAANTAAVVIALMVSNDGAPGPIIAVVCVAALFAALAYGAVAVYRRQQ